MMKGSLLLVGLALAAAPKAVPLDAKGEPPIDAGKQVAFWAWSDPKGLHFRWTAGEKAVLFMGSVVTDKPAGEIARINKLAGGWIDKKDETTVLFSATATAALDGMDVSVPPGASALLTVEIDGAAADPNLVFVGAKQAHPAVLPVRLLTR
jgi:hypothetical protein